MAISFKKLMAHYPEAATLLSRATCENPGPRWPWLYRPRKPLDRQAEMRHRASAQVLARALVRRQLKSPPLLVEQSQVLLRLGALQSALAVARTAAQHGAREPAVWFNLAHLYLELDCPRCVSINKRGREVIVAKFCSVFLCFPQIGANGSECGDVARGGGIPAGILVPV